MEENLPRHRANSRKARQETSIMYARARKPDLSGEIFAKCTPRQRFPILKSAKYAILAKMGCPRVHFSEILPERGPSAARAYIMLVSCHSVMFCPRVGALGALGVDGAVAAAISEPLMRGVFPGVGGMVTATAFKSPCGDAFGCWICRRKHLSRDSCVVAGIGNVQWSFVGVG